MEEWLRSPSTQKDIRLQLQARAKHLFARLAVDGTRAGSKLIKKVKVPGNLWEARIDHPTGAYRIFGAPAPSGRLVFVCVAMKQRTSFTTREYRQFEGRVRNYLASLGDGC